jgi:predicted secreted hydrolase
MNARRAAAIAAVIWLASLSDWARVEAPRTFEWPHDHGAHPEYRTEWWYATGELRSQEGRRFGYQLTLFRQGLERADESPGRSRLHADDVLAAHLAVVDIDAGRLLSTERVRRAAAGLAEARVGDLDAWVEDWSITRLDGDRLKLGAFDRERAIGIELELVATKPLVVHGAGGVSRKGPEPGNASAYMSWTRLRSSGAITFEGTSHEVTGESWFDHEWGTSQLGRGVVGWDWFGLRLSDGRELMLYRLRGEHGEATASSAATLVERDGRTRSLASTDFELSVLEHWSGAPSHARYPSRWKFSAPAIELEIEIATSASSCEIDGRASTGVTYWEGPVSVTGSASGSGYAELTGYAHSLADRF